MLNVPAQWRIPPSFLDRSPFAAGDHGRALRVILDETAVTGGSDLELLRAFARRPQVELYSTLSTAERRIELGPTDESRDVLPVRYVLPGGGREMALAAAGSWREHARRTAAEFDHSEAEAWRVLILAQAVQRHQLDALVSGSPVLGTPMWRGHWQKANPMDAREACALVGLYLRAHNDFTVRQDGSNSTFLGPEGFYRAAAVATLPPYVDWMHSAWTAWRDARLHEPFGLLRGMEARLGRALIARDYFSVRIRHWSPEETWDEALYFFESTLLSLSGALDSFARLCHLMWEVPGSRRRAGFQHSKWRMRLAERVPELTDALREDGRSAAIADLLGTLRNCIHGESPSRELNSYQAGPHTMDYGFGVIALDEREGARLLSAAEKLSGAEAFGVEAQDDGAVLVRPARYMPAVLGGTLSVLRELMATVALDRLTAERAMPFEPSYWLPGHEFASEVLLLAGLRGDESWSID